MFKRNQIEEAISKIDGDAVPSTITQTRLKRLLDTDRRLGRTARAQDPAASQFAFYDGDAPGSGSEVSYSAYEAFALFIALRFMNAGFPQATVVRMLRNLRPQLEPHHKVSSAAPPPSVRRRQAGDLALSGGAMLAIFHSGGTRGTARDDQAFFFKHSDDLFKFRGDNYPGRALTLISLTDTANALATALKDTIPTKRGRRR